MQTVYEIWFYFSTAVTVATILAELTPTNKDNIVMAKVNKFINVLSLRFKEIQQSKQ